MLRERVELLLENAGGYRHSFVAALVRPRPWLRRRTLTLERPSVHSRIELERYTHCTREAPTLLLIRQHTLIRQKGLSATT